MARLTPGVRLRLKPSGLPLGYRWASALPPPDTHAGCASTPLLALRIQLTEEVSCALRAAPSALGNIIHSPNALPFHNDPSTSYSKNGLDKNPDPSRWLYTSRQWEYRRLKLFGYPFPGRVIGVIEYE